MAMDTEGGAGDLPLPPGSMGLPFVGEGLDFVKNPFDFFEARYRQHGPIFKTRLFGDAIAVLVGPEAMAFFYDESIFSRKAASPPHLRAIFHPDAAPFLDGEAQKRRRRYFDAAFTPDAVAAYQPLVERVIGRHLDQLAAAGEVRATDALGLLCFAVGDALFAGADPERDRPELADAMGRVVLGLTALPVKLPFTTYGKAIAARDRMRAHVSEAVDAYRPGSADHVLERMLRARDDGAPMPRAELEIELFHFFGASYAALQAALCSTVAVLAAEPALLARARAEVDAAPAGPLDLARLELCHRIGLEVRRFHRIAPSTFVARALRDADFAGHRVPAGWKAVAIPHSTMRDDRVFPEAGRFDPDRYAPPRLEHERPGAWVPHGAGPWDGHRCAGEALATLVLDVFIALLVRRLTWELPPQDLSERMAGLSPLPRSGLVARFAPRGG